jgi:hypothetical protein
MMMRTFRIVWCLAILLPLLAGVTLAQQKPEPDKGPVVKVQVVLSRYDGDKKTSSLPFIMLATANGDKVSVRTGSQVPFPQPNGGFQYIDVGTNIDCTVKTVENGRFNVTLSINDRSATDKTATAVPSVPILRNFTYTNSILIKDGDSKQFVSASDKGSADIVKIDVTVSVEK